MGRTELGAGGHLGGQGADDSGKGLPRKELGNNMRSWGSLPSCSAPSTTGAPGVAGPPPRLSWSNRSSREQSRTLPVAIVKAGPKGGDV